jgi:hypothetical protein
MTSRRKKVRAFAVAVVITLVLSACAGEAGASQGTTKLANRTTGPAATGPMETGPTETGPTETGPTETGPTETGPTETASRHARASAEPDMIQRRACSDGARSRLELMHVEGHVEGHDRVEGWLKVRLEVYQSPPGHRWRIQFRFKEHNITTIHGHVIFEGTRVASDSGVFVVQLRRPDWNGEDGLAGKAVDRQTGEVCNASIWFE